MKITRQTVTCLIIILAIVAGVLALVLLSGCAKQPVPAIHIENTNTVHISSDRLNYELEEEQVDEKKSIADTPSELQPTKTEIE